MKNLFKKTLACCLVLCMVFTLCISALTVNAEAVTGTVTVGTADITTADKTATVDVTVDANPLAAAEVVVNVPAGLTIAGLAFTADDSVEITYAPAANPTGKPVALSEATEFVAPDVVDGKFTYIIHLPANTTTANAVVLSITFAGTFAEGKIDVAVASAEACYDAESDLIALTFVPGAINVTAAHVCNFVGTQTKAPTCTEAGVMTYACTCGEGTYTESIPVIPHTEEEIPAVPATCTTAGATAGVKCSVCDTVLTAPVAVDALGHDWNEGEVTTAPDCDDAGVKTYTCANDPSHTKEEAIDALGHKEVDVDAVAATCTETGLTAGKKCSVCGAFTVPQEEVKALGHNFGDNLEFCANNCGTANPNYVAPCDHDWVIVATKDATAEEEGWIDFDCSLCEATDHKTVMYWSRHTFFTQNLVLATQIEIKFGIREDRYNDSTLGNAEEGFAKITVDTATGPETTYITGLEDIVPVTPAGSREQRQVSVGLAAKQMTDDVTANTFIKVGGQWYSGNPKIKSVEDCAIAGMANAGSDTKGEQLKKLYADLLTYGAKVQKYFNYKAETLADANLGEYASYVTTEAPVIEEDVAQTAASTDIAIRTYNYGLTAAAKTEVKLFFRLDKMNPIPNINDVNVNLSYGPEGDKVNTIISGNTANFETTNRYSILYVDILPKFMRSTVTVTFDVNGVDANNTLTFSIAGLAARMRRQNAADGDLVAIYNSMINFADAAATYFAA